MLMSYRNQWNSFAGCHFELLKTKVKECHLARFCIAKSCLICALSAIIYIYNIRKWDELSSESGLGQVVLGRDFRGANCLEASCLWCELSCFHWALKHVYYAISQIIIDFDLWLSNF